jgi:hypothetical protein
LNFAVVASTAPQTAEDRMEIAERADDAGLLSIGQIGHALDAGGRRHDLQSMWSGDDGVLQ